MAKTCAAAGMCYCICDDCRISRRPVHCWEHRSQCHKGCPAVQVTFR